MKLFLDACVLFPVATREILLGYAREGGFAPLWSERVLEEWRRAAAAKLDAEEAARAEGDRALMAAWFPGALTPEAETEAGEIWSPDPADIHVIAAALAGGAAGVVTFNLRDFPLRALRPHGLARHHPDEFLATACRAGDDRLMRALAPLAATAAARGASFRTFLKRAALPRLGKAWEVAQGSPEL